MDNLTHTLAGLLVGEIAVSAQPAAKRAARRPGFWLTSLVANNLPDLDFLYVGITSGKVGYLLHHRGHTHTVLAAFPAVLVTLALAWLYLRATKQKTRAVEWYWLTGLAALGHWLHIAMDAMNSYGVHPFWPWHAAWYYGDFMFIVEPWLWMGLVPPLLFGAKGRLARCLLAIPLFGGLVLVWVFPLVPWYAALLVSVWAATVWFVMAGLRPDYRPFAGFAAAIAAVLIFAAISHHNRETVGLRYRGEGRMRLGDVILSPLPSNPFCWAIITVETDDVTYRLRKGLFAAFPRVVPARRCPVFRMGQGSAPLVPVSEPQTDQTWWLGELVGSVARLRELNAGHCGIAAALRFVRAPFLVETPGDYLIGDLRFDHRRGPGFAQMTFPKRMDACPAHVPPWEPPARSLLGP